MDGLCAGPAPLTVKSFSPVFHRPIWGLHGIKKILIEYDMEWKITWGSRRIRAKVRQLILMLTWLTASTTEYSKNSKSTSLTYCTFLLLLRSHLYSNMTSIFVRMWKRERFTIWSLSYPFYLFPPHPALGECKRWIPGFSCEFHCWCQYCVPVQPFWSLVSSYSS